MSNINPNPRFIPTPGTPTAAPPHFPFHHATLADPITWDCPKCGAPAGYLCEGIGLPGGTFHGLRKRAAPLSIPDDAEAA